MRTPAILTALLVSTCACRSRPPSTPEEIEAALQTSSRSVVREESFTLFSPYDEATTAQYATVVREQEGLVRRLFADPGIPPVRLYLVPVPADGEPAQDSWREVSRDGWGGGAFAEGFAFIYVRETAGPMSALINATLGARTLRHELAHVYARRAGLVRASWFQEGMAREIENSRVEGSVLHPHAFPPALVGARDSQQPGSLPGLLQWKLADELTVEERTLRYDESQSLFRFLVVRQADGDWLHRARAALALPDEQSVALEPEWLSWLAGLDALDAISRGVRSASGGERAESASLLPILAERGARELFTHAADLLALELLADPVTRSSAGSFLLFFRARDLDDGDVDALSGSSDPTLCLTGLALCARRGEPFDLERARAAWARVPERDRTSLTAQQLLIPGLVERDGAH